MGVFKKSEVTERGEKVSYVTQYGGIGLGYVVEGVVVNSGGNGWYYPVENVQSYHRDNGDMYMGRVRLLCGGR